MKSLMVFGEETDGLLMEEVDSLLVLKRLVVFGDQEADGLLV